MLRAEDLSSANLAGNIVFSAIGFAAFIYGKKNSSWRAMILGGTLMVYPYFITETLGLYVIGTALTATLLFWRE